MSLGVGKKLTKNISVLPSLNLSKKEALPHNHCGKILQVLSAQPRYFYCQYSVPVAAQGLSYISDQIRFVDNLNTKCRKLLTIRPDMSGAYNSWDTAGMFRKAGYEKNFDVKNRPLMSDLKKMRLCISTQNTTVFLQTLSMNFPTITFWNPNYSEIRLEALPFIKLLKNAGILFFSPLEAAEQVNLVSDNVEDWWFSQNIQSARTDFCKNFAYTSDNYMSDWTKFFNQKRS